MTIAGSSANATRTNNTSTFGLQNPPWILSMSDESRISLMVLYSVLFLLAIVGNSSVVAIVCKNQQMQTTMNFLIVNMAASDLAGSLMTIPRKISVLSTLSYEFQVLGIFGKMLCKLCPFIRDLSITISIESMIAIAFDRFFAVVYPMRRKPRILKIKFIVPMTWFFGSVMFSLDFVLYEFISLGSVQLCIYEWPTSFLVSEEAFTVGFMVLTFILPTIVLAVLYLTIVCKIKSQAIPGQQPFESIARRRKQNAKVIKMSTAIVMTFLICWLPYHTSGFLITFLWKSILPSFLDILDEATTFLSFVSFATNPIICLTFSSKFRNCLKKLIPLPDLFSKRRQGVMDVNTPRSTNISQEMITISATNLTMA